VRDDDYLLALFYIVVEIGYYLFPCCHITKKLDVPQPRISAQQFPPFLQFLYLFPVSNVFLLEFGLVLLILFLDPVGDGLLLFLD
jgi:hypothetical protein